MEPNTADHPQHSCISEARILQTIITDQNQLSKLEVFEIEAETCPMKKIAFATINQSRQLQISLLKFNVQPMQSFVFESNHSMIESFWTRTYRTNVELPKCLFQMRSTHKIFDYLNDPSQRVIETEEKDKNGSIKLMFNIKVPVTKNITDFVALALQLMSPDQLILTIQQKKDIYASVEQKIRELAINRKINQLKKQQQKEQIKQKEKQQIKEWLNQICNSEQTNRQEGELSEQLFIGNEKHQDELSTGEDIEYISFEQSNTQQETQINRVRSKGMLNQPIELEQIEPNFSPLSHQQDSHQLQEQAECPELAKEYISLLETKNQFLLGRVLALQLQLLKKNIRLESYQDGYSDIAGIQSVIEKKYFEKIKNKQRTVNQLRNLFVELKHTSKIESSEETLSSTSQFNKVICQMEKVFDKIY